MKLVFIWIQWSGKWTQGRILEEKFWFKVFDVGSSLRNIAKENSELWKSIKSIIEKWEQVSPAIIEDILRDILEKNKSWNIIFDWFIRNEWNKDTFDKIVWDYKVVFFDLPEIDAKQRLLWRMYDKQTWETFIAGTKINPKNWNKLEKRADDEEQAINTRIRLFYDVTMPIVEKYRKSWNIIEINAKWTIEEITLRLKESLWL